MWAPTGPRPIGPLTLVEPVLSNVLTVYAFTTYHHTITGIRLLTIPTTVFLVPYLIVHDYVYKRGRQGKALVNPHHASALKDGTSGMALATVICTAYRTIMGPS